MMRQYLPSGARSNEEPPRTLDQRWARWQEKPTPKRPPTYATAWWEGCFWGWFWGSWKERKGESCNA